MYITYFLIFNTILQLSIAALDIENVPCYCEDLQKNIRDTRRKLIKVYGQQNLDLPPTFSTSGIKNSLEHSILRTLENGQNEPFRIGVLGGSYSLPSGDFGNAWSFNISRWLNIMFSVSSCNEKTSNKTIFINNLPENCINDVRYEFQDCNTHKVSPNKATFCSKFDNSELEGHYHTKYLKRTIDTICDNTLPPKRECKVFGGSGNYSTLILGSKGGTTTHFGKWTIQNFGFEELDLLIWDFSNNDFVMMHEHLNLFTGFFSQLFAHQPKLSAFAMVYWNMNSRGNLNEECKSNEGKSIFFNELAEADYIFFKHLFIKNYTDIALLTMSINSFCIAKRCNINDFVSSNSNHPSDQGVSMFADLFIWQLLKSFEHVYNVKCKMKSNTFSNWVIDNKPNLKKQFNNPGVQWMIEAIRSQQLIHVQYPSYKIIATLVFPTPIFIDPLPIDMLAIMCSVSDKVNVSFNTFNSIQASINIHVFQDINIQPPQNIRWSIVDIIEVISNECAGFTHVGKRNIDRSDDFHVYSPLISSVCYDSSNCVAPTNWPSNTYPHKPYPNFPMIKPVDIVFRVSTNLDYSYMCFFNCIPNVIWRWKDNMTINSYPMLKITSPPDLFKECYRTDFNKDDLLNIEEDHYIIQWPADSCFPFKNNTPISINSQMMLIK